MGSQRVTDADIETFARDGVLCLRGALCQEWLDLAELAIRRIRNAPGPYATHYFAGEPGEFYDDHVNYAANPELQILLRQSPVADIMKDILQTNRLWLFYDQIFIKEGGYSARTPWHQDTPYWMTQGAQLGSMWISLESLEKHEALEFVPGSHRGPLYNAMVFEGDGPGTPWYDSEDMPILPDIEKERDQWNIVSWATEPGDVLLLHPSVLHGGGPMREGGRRRTLSLRFFGDDAVYVERPGKPAPLFPGVAQALKPGDPLRHDYFPLIRGD